MWRRTIFQVRERVLRASSLPAGPRTERLDPWDTYSVDVGAYVHLPLSELFATFSWLLALLLLMVIRVVSYTAQPFSFLTFLFEKVKKKKKKKKSTWTIS
jgi:hypothetical protein